MIHIDNYEQKHTKYVYIENKNKMTDNRGTIDFLFSSIYSCKF